ncbi:heat shock protein transcriptional repressor HspR [Actinomyces minihominis]|uniref:heat shock protein transcriptional repressor HspR n=1 Tax=Actinomyces minihominis TaxID=2002838 RepID=UPI000C07CCEE|nr:helix-turn-helix transcriptional regulator [Actinomyces minihominis]
MSQGVASGSGGVTGQATYTVSVAATLSGMHAQTLRQYDRIGLVVPGRTKGRGRRYSHSDIERLRYIQQLTQESGINLAGVQRILSLEDRVRELEAQLVDLHGALAKSRVPVKGVYTADSTGRVQFRPRPVSSLSIPVHGEDEVSEAIEMSREVRLPVPSRTGAELVGLTEAQRRNPAVQLPVRPGTALSKQGLTGWQLFAELQLSALARKRHRRGKSS